MWTIDAHQSCFIPSICVVDVDRLKAHLFSDDRRTLDLFEAGIFRLSRWALAVESLPVDAAAQSEIKLGFNNSTKSFNLRRSAIALFSAHR